MRAAFRLAINLSTKRDFFGSDDKMIGFDIQFTGNNGERLARFASQQITDLLPFQSMGSLEGFDRFVPLAQDRLHVLAMKFGNNHDR